MDAGRPRIRPRRARSAWPRPACHRRSWRRTARRPRDSGGRRGSREHARDATWTTSSTADCRGDGPRPLTYAIGIYMRKAHKSEVEAIRVSLVELRRLFQRRELVELWATAAGSTAGLDYTELRLLDAIRVAEARGNGATVGDASRLLGVDPSRASRQVARAVAKGLLRRRAEQGDGRKVLLEVTARGAALQ